MDTTAKANSDRAGTLRSPAVELEAVRRGTRTKEPHRNGVGTGRAVRRG